MNERGKGLIHKFNFVVSSHTVPRSVETHDIVVVLQFSSRRSPSCSEVWNHGRAHPAPCVRPRRVCSVFMRAHVQFCRFDKADASANVQ